MHVTPPPSTSAPVVLPPLAPGYAWTLTPHGWCPAPYDGPPLAPLPAPRPTTPATPQAVLRAALFNLAARDPRLARAAARMLAKVWQRPSTAPPAPLVPATSSPATSTTAAAPSTPAPSHAAPSPADTADPLADVPPSVLALAEQDGLVARGLADLAEARQTRTEARCTAIQAIRRYGPIPREHERAAPWLAQLYRERPEVAEALRAYSRAAEESERAARALAAAVQPHATDTSDRHGPPSTAAEPSTPEPTPPPRLDAAQLRERDPTVARALAAHVETTEHAQTAAETFAAALDRHGAGPNDPTARATWVRTLADHDRDVAIALAAALATVEATEHTAAQLDAALAPYAARAPPLREPFDA